MYGIPRKAFLVQATTVARLGAFTALILMAIAALVLTPGCSSGDGQSTAKPKKGPIVRVAAVQRAPISRTLELGGEVVSTNSVVIAATVEGPISFCPWREGDGVQQGQKLVEIDRQAYRAELQAAEAGLAVAVARLDDLKAGTRPEEVVIGEQEVHQQEAAVARIQTELDRARMLLPTGGVSREDFERSQADLKGAEADLAAARSQLEMLQAGPTMTEIAVQQAVVAQASAALELARARLAECVVTAPFDATVAAVHVRPGDLAVPRTPLLELVDLSSLVIRFAVPEESAGAVRLETPINVVLDAYPGRTFHAQVTRMYPSLDTTMRTRTVEATVQESTEFMPGMFARLTLLLETAPEAVVVPREAILVTPKGQNVLFVFHDGSVAQRTVVTGIEQGERVQVLEGVAPGEQVVVAGNEKLKDGVAATIAGAGRGSQSGGQAGSGGAGKKPAAGGGQSG